MRVVNGIIMGQLSWMLLKSWTFLAYFTYIPSFYSPSIFLNFTSFNNAISINQTLNCSSFHAFDVGRWKKGNERSLDNS